MRYGIKEWIKIPDLKKGYLYRIAARNADYGIWIPEKECFIISRVKFFDNFLFEEHHWDSPAWATVKPLEEIEKAPFELEDLEMVEKINKEGYKYLGYSKGTEILVYLNTFRENPDIEINNNKKKWTHYEDKKKKLQ